MNILIPNSWLKDYLDTNATPQEFAEAMSLTSVSIERVNEVDGDFVYDIEVTTNRPDLMSVEGIAREASAVLPQAGYKAIFKAYEPKISLPPVSSSGLIKIENDPRLVNRITAIVLDVVIKPSPQEITDRLEKTDIRSLNNVIDVTNYIMRELGHPVHAFDYDRLANHTLIIRKSKPGEKITTLDGKEYELPGNDIVADDGTGKLIDLLGIMGLENSSITDATKRVLLFIDNNNPHILRKTSMNLGIRTEAAVLNEKGVDPEKMIPTILRGVELLERVAEGKVVSDLIDIYPNKVEKKTVSTTFSKINEVIGINIPETTIRQILTNLGFEVQSEEDALTVAVPPARANDIDIPEDIIEEVARVYGYSKIPNILPPISSQEYYHQEKDEYYWVRKIKEAFKYWGFNETYTYSMVNEALFDGPIDRAVGLRNPLDEDHTYMRNRLTPSLLDVSHTNKSHGPVRIFELSNVYLKRDGLPEEKLHLAALFKGDASSFFEAKGTVERVFQIMGIENVSFSKKQDGIEGATVSFNGQEVGVIESDDDEITFELDFSAMLDTATPDKIYKQPSKFPPVIEDIRIAVSPEITYETIKKVIEDTHPLVHSVSLLDVYGNKKTFRITYLSFKDNLTNEIITPVRESIYSNLEQQLNAVIG